jgi:predicted DNA-binding protein
VETKKFNMNLEEDLYKKLQVLSERNHRTMSQHVRFLIARDVEHSEAESGELVTESQGYSHKI